MPASNFASAIGQGLNFANQQEQQKLVRQQRLLSLDKSRLQNMFSKARIVNTLLKSGQIQEASNVLADNANLITSLGGDPSDTLEIADFVARNDIDGATSLLDAVEQAGIKSEFLTDPKAAEAKKDSAELRAFNEMIKDLTPTEQKLAKRIKLGLSPRAVGSAFQTISQDEKLTQDVAQTEKIISAAKETGKLASQFKLQPKIAEAVGIANTKVKEIADDTKLSKSNNKALSIYEVGIKALSEALDQTSTGPIVDILPALTANAQSAEGAIAMMGPTLKGVFREAGEGTFTEGDQKLLMDMLPTRKDLPTARDFKMKTIDAMIRLKLGGNTGISNAAQTQQSQPNQVVNWGDL